MAANAGMNGLTPAATAMGMTMGTTTAAELDAMAARGARGVVVLRQMLQFLDQHGHRTRAMLAVPTRRRRWIDSAGTVIRDDPELLPFSSWDTVYRSLCSMLPPGAVHYGHAVASVAEDAEGVEIRFDDDMAPVHADLLIAADGVNSLVRRRCLPEAGPEDSGAVTLYGKTPLDAATRAQLAPELLRGVSVVFALFGPSVAR